MVCFTFYFFCTPNQSYTPLNPFFFKNTYTFIHFYLVLYLQLVGSWGLIKYYQLEVQLAYLVDFAKFLLRFTPHLTFLLSKLQSYTLWNHFSQEYIYIYFFNLVLYLLLVGSQGGLENTTDQSYSLHLVDFAQFLLQFALNFAFWCSIQSNTTLESLFHEYLLVSWSYTSSRQDLKQLRKYYRLEVLHAFTVNVAHFIYFLIYGKTFLHSMLVLYCCGVTPFS